MLGSLTLLALLTLGPWNVASAAHRSPARVSGPPATLGAPDDEIVKEFKRYFRKYKDSATRVEAILALEGVESPEVVEVLHPILKDTDEQVAQAARRVLSGFKTRPVIDHLLLRFAEEKDERLLTSYLQILAVAGYAGAEEALAACLEHKDWDVRRRAIQASVKLAGEGLVERILPLCQDPETAVRCAALRGLAQLRSEAVLVPARAELVSDSWQVRAAAIEALGVVRHVDSIGPLIERMELEEGRLSADIGAALVAITGRDFGQRLDAWQNFWKTFQGRFKIPTDEELALLRAKQAERKEAYEGAPGATKYHGIETPSRSVLFVIDVSGSMEQEVVDRERYKDGGYPSFKRIDIVKTELMRTIEGLESYVEFNVHAFATEIDLWKKGQVKANPLNKSSAMTWISRLEAIGGESKQDLAEAGLTGSANLEAGKTNTYGALITALGVDLKKPKSGYETNLDTIFFLSDGRPSHGEYIETGDILREVLVANELRGIVIHTIAIGEFKKEFMRELAKSSGGVFVDLGR